MSNDAASNHETGPIVYFLQDPKDQTIKIGTTSRSVEQRMAQIACETHRDLVLLATVEGAREVEQGLHRRFGTLRIRDEWFNPGPELLAFIEAARGGQQKATGGVVALGGNGLTQCQFRFPQAAVDGFDTWAAEENVAAGYEKHSRSDIMRDILLKALAERKTAKAPEKKRRTK